MSDEGKLTTETKALHQKATHIYVQNSINVPYTRFSIPGQLYIHLFMRAEALGYILPKVGLDGHRILPHVSVGPMFHDYLVQHHFDSCQKFIRIPFYENDGTQNGIGNASFQYDLVLLPLFINWLYTVWLQKNAFEYFKRKDPNMLEFLPQLVLDEKQILEKLSREALKKSTESDQSLEVEVRKTIKEYRRNKYGK